MTETRVMKADSNANRLLYAIDIAGTALFAMEGAVAAIGANLDFFGMMVLSFATALAGGIIRDVLIGDVPPASIRNWHYAAVAFATAALVFLFHHGVQEIPSWLVLTLDAGGLGLFAIAGTEKALDFKIPPLLATLMGTITGVGGGTVRDLFLARVPAVLQSDIYATAALAGSIVFVVARKMGLSNTAAAIFGGTFCFVLRIVAVWRHWALPHVITT